MIEKNILSIIVPAFNEEQTAQLVIKKLAEVKYPCDFEIIFINDGSTDLTYEKIIILQPQIPNLKIVSYKKNSGKGFAVRVGLAKSYGNIFIIQDADLEYDPEEIPVLIGPLINKSADFVIGDRLTNIKKKNIYYFANIIFSFLISSLFCKKISDFGCCYKAFTKKAANSLGLTLNDFGFDVEFVSKAIKNNFKIIEMPISYKPRSRKEGKKIGWTDGIKAIFYIFKFRFFI